MTTKTIDSTVSQLLQDNSSVEYVAPETNPTATVSNDDTPVNPLFDFNAVHNGEACIESLDPKDRGTERRFRFTRALLCTLLGVKSDNTISNHIEALLKRGVIEVVKNLTTLKIPTNGGVQETILYDLKVFNYLVMRLDTDRAWEMKAKFNDVLVERETQTQSVQPTIYDYARALIAEKERSDALEAQNKALTAERDEAIRTKTQYQSNLAAQMSGRVGGLTTALNRVKLENDRLKGDRLTKEDVYIIMNTQGVSFTLKTVKDVIRDELNTISEFLREPFPKITTGERTDPNGKTFEVKSFVYTRKAVQAFFEFVENNPMGWQARNRKFILCEWLHHGMTIPA